MASNISYTGAFSASTLIVPGVYLNVLPSGQSVIGPATFDLLGIVGVASWGPVGQAFTLGNSGQLPLFGNPTVRQYDLVLTPPSPCKFSKRQGLDLLLSSAE